MRKKLVGTQRWEQKEVRKMRMWGGNGKTKGRKTRERMKEEDGSRRRMCEARTREGRKGRNAGQVESEDVKKGEEGKKSNWRREKEGVKEE